MTKDRPRISVNKLSEYITALPGRRKTIIKQQKHPSTYIVPYYKLAEDIIINYLTTIDTNDDWLNGQVQQLLEKSVFSDWDETRRNVCIDAIDSFIEFVEDLDFRGLKCIAGKTDAPKLSISEVQVSVRPEIYLVNSNNEVKGCLKLVFSKERSVVDSEASYTGVCLQRWMNEQYQVSDHKSCFILDVFRQNSYTAPKAYKKRMSDIEVACEEIYHTWFRV